MTTGDRELLSRIVAAVEVLWWPIRHRMDVQPIDRVYQTVMQKRREYRRFGIGWTVGGSAADRQSGSRALRRLATSGAIVIRRATRQRCAISLRDIDQALSVTANRLLTQAWPALKLVGLLTDHPAILRNGHFIDERDVVGIPPDSVDGRKAEEFAFDALPLLICGHLETASDTEGRLGWRITKSGRRALADGPPKSKRLEYCGKIAAKAELLSELGLEERASWTPDNVNDLTLPLSAGMWSTRKEALAT